MPSPTIPGPFTAPPTPEFITELFVRLQTNKIPHSDRRVGSTCSVAEQLHMYSMIIDVLGPELLWCIGYDMS